MFLSNEMNCWRIRIDKGPDAYLIPLLGSREAVIMLCDPIFAPSLKRLMRELFLRKCSDLWVKLSHATISVQ